VSSSGFSKSGKPILLWEIFLVGYDRLTPDSQRIFCEFRRNAVATVE
jgi:hypothetical protein